MDDSEVKLRCIEAAARFPTPHNDGYAAGTLETAKAWVEWILDEQKPAAPVAIPEAPIQVPEKKTTTLGLPKK